MALKYMKDVQFPWHQGNSNPTETPLHTHAEKANVKKTAKLSVAEGDTEQLVFLYTVGWSINWYNHFGKLAVSDQVNIFILYNSAIILNKCVYPTEMYTYVFHRHVL